MEQKPMTSLPSKSSVALPVVVSVILSAAITGGIVYAVQSKQNRESRANLQSQVDTLRSQLAVEPVASPTPTLSATAAPGASLTYRNASLGLSFMYPSSWRLVTASPASCPPAAADFKATTCPLTGTLSPQAYLDALTKKYGSSSNSLVSFSVYQNSPLSLEDLSVQFKTEFASQDGQTSSGSSTLTIDGLKGFFLNQRTSSYSDNIYVIQLAAGKYITFTNRESDKHYTTQGAVDDSNDNTTYSEAVRQIVDSVRAL